MFTFSCRAFMKPTSTGRRLQRVARAGEGQSRGGGGPGERLGWAQGGQAVSTWPGDRQWPVEPWRSVDVGAHSKAAHAPMAERGDEVQTAVHAVVLDVLAVEAALVAEILLELLVHIVSDGLPAAEGQEGL